MESFYENGQLGNGVNYEDGKPGGTLKGFTIMGSCVREETLKKKKENKMVSGKYFMKMENYKSRETTKMEN